MKKILLSVVGVLMGLYATSYAQSTVDLVQNGKARFVVVVSDSASSIIGKSAEELNGWIAKISGVKLPVVKLSQWDGKTPYIAVGQSALTTKNGWDQEPYDKEEARIFIEKGKIGLLGNDRSPYSGVEWQGTYYAVNEFVRKSLGVRWIWPGELGEVYEKRSFLSVASGKWNWVPQLHLVREIVYSGMISNKGLIDYYQAQLKIDLRKNQQWLEKRKLTRKEYKAWADHIRLGISSDIRFGHAFESWWERFGKHHPDWFAKPPAGLTQRGGKGVKLNISNPEVHDQTIKDWKALWEADPDRNRYLRASPNDSRGFDTRPETRAWDAPEMQRFSDKDIFNGSEPILSDRYVKLWNILARRIREISPEAQLSTYAYRNYRRPPLGNEQLENNIIISYVGGEGYYPDETFIRDEWREWARRGARMVWRPNLFHAGHGTPYLYSKRLHSDMQFFMQNGMEGFRFDSMVGNWAGQGLNYYMVGELHIRPSATYEELTDEYFSAFGPAKDAVKRYHLYLEELTAKTPQVLRDHNLVPYETWGGWWKAHIRVIPLIFTPEVISKGEALLNEARMAVKNSERVYLDRIDFIAEGLAHAGIMAKAFGELRLHEPTVQVDYANSKEILQPLWDFRMERFGNMAFSVERYIYEEQRQFGIWNAFKTSDEIPQTQERAVDLESGWKFRIDPTNVGNTQQWYLKQEATNWQEIQVAQPWRQGLPKVTNSKIGWYMLQFEVPELEDTGEKVYLRFGSVDAEVKIWVNGRLIHERGYPHNGNYDSWDESFDVDVTNAIKTAAHNALVVRVESERTGAGITGKVQLVLD